MQFGHSSDPVEDFCEEVKQLTALSQKHAIWFFETSKAMHDRQTILDDRISKAMGFKVGGSAKTLAAKETLRKLDELHRNVSATPPVFPVAGKPSKAPSPVLHFPLAAGLPQTTCHLRPMKIGKDEVAIHYTPISFLTPSSLQRTPFLGCKLLLEQLELFGFITLRAGPLKGALFLDVLDGAGDILDTFEITASGWKYLSKLYFFQRLPN